MLYPWRYGMTVCEELTVIGFVADPPIGNFKPDEIRSHRLPAPSGLWESWQLKTEASVACFVTSPWDVW